MRVKASLLIASLGLGLLLTGCSNARTLEGTWVSDGQASSTISVTGDAFKQSGSVMGTAFSVTGKGVYDDKASTLTITELKLEAPGAPPQLVSAASAQMPKETVINVSWKTGDEIVLSSPNPSQMNASGSFNRKR